jgi:putative ABC transport system permease protein
VVVTDPRSSRRFPGPRPVGELLRFSATALAGHKLRTSLSVLGVVIGVAAVIAMLSVSEGARREVLAEVGRLGLNNILVRSRPLPAGGSRAASQGLTVADAGRLLGAIPSATGSATVVQRFLPVSGPAGQTLAFVSGATASYQVLLRLAPASGRLLSPVDEASRTCLIGRRLARALFRGANPVSQQIQIDRRWFTVVGVLTDGASRLHLPEETRLPDLEESLLVPLSALLRRPAALDPGQQVDQIWLKARDGEAVIRAGEVARRTLSRLHGGQEDFSVVIPRALLEQRLHAQRVFDVVIGSVAALSLLVGGIGIMNIMLASVVSRTQEIGIQRTVGATRGWIVSQFLAESALMTFAGGIAGVVLGVGVARFVDAFAGWPTLVSLPAVIIALGVSVLVGLIFGIYPAARAARLDPIEAVRYE